MMVEVKPSRSSRLSSKNQLTIPVSVLKTAGLRPGDLVEVESTEPGRIVLRRWESRFAAVTGTVPGLEDHVDLEAQRNQWDR